MISILALRMPLLSTSFNATGPDGSMCDDAQRLYPFASFAFLQLADDRDRYPARRRASACGFFLSMGWFIVFFLRSQADAYSWSRSFSSSSACCRSSILFGLARWYSFQFGSSRTAGSWKPNRDISAVSVHLQPQTISSSIVNLHQPTNRDATGAGLSQTWLVGGAVSRRHQPEDLLGFSRGPVSHVLNPKVIR